MSKGLSKTVILNTPIPPAGKETWLHDDLVQGLSVRIRAGRATTFYFSRRAHGKFGRLSLGTLEHLGSVETAREVARGHNRTISANGNPFADKAAHRAQAAKMMPTVETLWDDFRVNHVEARYKPTSAALCGYLWLHLKPWAGRRLGRDNPGRGGGAQEHAGGGPWRGDG